MGRPALDVPLSSVELRLEDPDFYLDRMETDSQGHFTFGWWPAGRYRLRLYGGARPVETVLELAPNERREDIVLEHEAH